MRNTDLSSVPADALSGRRIAADYVADGLREAILSGSLQDGAVLNQTAIAERFGVSRVPVREAMRQLQAEGLIETEAHHVAVVRGLSLDRIGELYDYRGLIEGYLTLRAVPKISDQDIARLRQIEREMRTIDDHNQWLDGNATLHDLLLSAAGDETGLELVRQLRSRAERYVRMWSGGSGIHRVVDTGREHRELIDLVASRDAEAAREAVERHIRHTREQVVAYGRTVMDGAEALSAVS